jgi:hypothetical protein
VAARVVDHVLGGWHTFPADRLFAEHAELACPGFIHDVRANRDFGRRVVRWMAAQGVRQFLDVGCGLPMNGATHETLAHLGVPGRVVYVDRDPVAVAFAQNLRPTPPGVTAICGDLRDPDSILNNDVRDQLDFDQPIAVLLLGVLAHMADSDHPDQILGRLRCALAPGSYLGLSHAVHQPLMRHEQRRLRLLYRVTPTPLHHRTEDKLLQLLSGWDLVAPGLVPIGRWRPDDRPMAAAGALASVAGAVASVPEARVIASARSATTDACRSGRRVLPINPSRSEAAASLGRDVSLVPSRPTPNRPPGRADRAC